MKYEIRKERNKPYVHLYYGEIYVNLTQTREVLTELSHFCG